MNIGEFIEQLKTMPPETMVIKRRSEGGGRYRWDSMDGWSPQMVDVVPSSNVLNEGVYCEPGRWSKDQTPIEALEI